jgi:hypothetical protein
VNFRITRHSGFTSSTRPANAIDLLANRLGTGGGELSFKKVGAEIVATWGEDAPVSMEQDERVEHGRRAILEIVVDVCSRAPELDSDWFAVSPKR